MICALDQLTLATNAKPRKSIFFNIASWGSLDVKDRGNPEMKKCFYDNANCQRLTAHSPQQNEMNFKVYFLWLAG
jgi:hypothetical protein